MNNLRVKYHIFPGTSSVVMCFIMFSNKLSRQRIFNVFPNTKDVHNQLSILELVDYKIRNTLCTVFTI
jgi:hypothetical protein